MKRITSFIIILLIYIIAFIIGFAAYDFLNLESYILKIIICDIIATFVVFIFSTLFKNSSIYDPYWSFAPLIMILFFIEEINYYSILMIIVIYLWGLRLTINWVYTFKGLKYQDWRYSFYKNKFPKLWPLVNFFGIHLMPTLVVASVMIPSFKYLQINGNVNIYTMIGALLSIIGIILELISDIEMHRFQKENPGKVNTTGLWKYSRHPNYLGEITMWWGIFIMMISINPNDLIFIVGPILNTLMFRFISIPLMEGRQLKNKPEYYQYKSSTSMLFILPNRKVKEETVE